uniref:Uncharacterized protein n=1 Tax=Caenorhabditis tropicalis TaxID=1561998 RepID=A0A1I7TU63_9PELO
MVFDEVDVLDISRNYLRLVNRNFRSIIPKRGFVNVPRRYRQDPSIYRRQLESLQRGLQKSGRVIEGSNWLSDEKLEQEFKYNNRGTITIETQNVQVPDLVDGLDLGNPVKKSIPSVKWSTNPIDFFEIGEDVDQFEFDSKEGGFSSSSVMTASIKKIG